jgi:hypothetical protein
MDPCGRNLSNEDLRLIFSYFSAYLALPIRRSDHLDLSPARFPIGSLGISAQKRKPSVARDIPTDRRRETSSGDMQHRRHPRTDFVPSGGEKHRLGLQRRSIKTYVANEIFQMLNGNQIMIRQGIQCIRLEI